MKRPAGSPPSHASPRLNYITHTSRVRSKQPMLDLSSTFDVSSALTTVQEGARAW